MIYIRLQDIYIGGCGGDDREVLLKVVVVVMV